MPMTLNDVLAFKRRCEDGGSCDKDHRWKMVSLQQKFPMLLFKHSTFSWNFGYLLCNVLPLTRGLDFSKNFF